MEAPLLSRSHRRRVGDKQVVLLWRYDFNIDDAAPLTTPHVGDIGTATIVDTGDFFDIATGRLRVSDVTGNADPSIADDVARDRDVGLMLYAIANSDGRCYLGFDSAKNALVTDTALQFRTAAQLLALDNGIETGTIGVVTALTDYEIAVIFRSAGAFYLIKGGSEFPDWTLLWVGVNEAEGSQYAQIATRSAGNNVHAYDNFRGSLLAAPWDTDNGYATEVLAGARSAGDTFNHEKDFYIEAEIATIPSGDEIELRFRIQDATNYWRVTIDSGGDIDLDEVVAGTPTQRGTAAGVIANSDRISIIADDDVITVHEDTTLHITYSSATNFKTATAGELEKEGTAGAVTDIISWPRFPSGRAVQALEDVANAR